jgi:hypothetical protein
LKSKNLAGIVDDFIGNGIGEIRDVLTIFCNLIIITNNVVA